MARVIEIRNQPFSLLDALWSLVGCAFLMAVGVFITFMGYSFFKNTPGGNIGAYVFAGVFFIGGIAIVIGSILALYWAIATPFDRSVKISATDEGLIDHRLSEHVLVRWDEIRDVSLKTFTMNGVRQSEVLSFTTNFSEEPVKLSILGLDREADEFTSLVERRLGAARDRMNTNGRKFDSRPCPDCNGKGHLVRPWENDLGTLQSSCQQCEGSGFTPGRQREEWLRQRPAEVEAILSKLLSGAAPSERVAAMFKKPAIPAARGPSADIRKKCPACNGLSPGQAIKCYHCGQAI